MENYTSEVMNAQREAQAYDNAECELERANLIAQGYKWFSVPVKCRDETVTPVEVLALTTNEARKQASEFGEVVGEPLTAEQAEAM